ncbi:MAG: ribosome biogenesis GTPase Der [Candidatus Competibacteraceae bacterium]|nr:ribosome biogenesis GTPase Der [Candidatus Competibacteraceae bacterium]MBK7983533.1 ribosome biogenesis GTPase Der [Candidatus Competibacteraceae bacterium]MBK8897927.1 ribosome biogenesis GTPase Der [Candidatus Competibacteraceae bacterium]MBK8961730.1 ribosome biogenesis GTPase Der [Candidatus Competibacteraceae bacterium]MBK9950948.1 ribosome biogenesis GTPase Der [Candidatus Competibacteraceae bacterium]
MLPVIALVGRPNVGKSTLFNSLTRTRDALVADLPGLTRDRQYGIGQRGPSPYVVVDTGGLTDESEGLARMVRQQAWRAIEEADAVLLLVDGRAGLTAADEDIAKQLRRAGKPFHLVINKAEHRDPDVLSADFHALGLDHLHTIAAVHNQGVETLMEAVFAALPAANEVEISRESEAAEEPERAIKLAVVGRPNVGKSTLVNRLLGEERMLACDLPGTTRDSVAVPFERDGQRYVLIDTAGVRRRGRISEAVEKFSVIKALQAIEQSHVAVLVLDARQGVSEQDASLLGLLLDSGRALVIAVNKWDHLDPDTRAQVKNDLDRRLNFLDFAKIHFISALHGTGVGELIGSVREAHAAATRKLSTPELTRILEDALAAHQPPLVQGHSIKLRYAHQGGQNPPMIVIHGNRVAHVPESYRRYLAGVYRKRLNLWGTPVRIEFRGGENPFKPAGGRTKGGGRSKKPN